MGGARGAAPELWSGASLHLWEGQKDSEGGQARGQQRSSPWEPGLGGLQAAGKEEQAVGTPGTKAGRAACGA